MIRTCSNGIASSWVLQTRATRAVFSTPDWTSPRTIPWTLQNSRSSQAFSIQISTLMAKYAYPSCTRPDQTQTCTNTSVRDGRPCKVSRRFCSASWASWASQTSSPGPTSMPAFSGETTGPNLKDRSSWTCSSPWVSKPSAYSLLHYWIHIERSDFLLPFSSPPPLPPSFLVPSYIHARTHTYIYTIFTATTTLYLTSIVPITYIMCISYVFHTHLYTYFTLYIDCLKLKSCM